MERKRRVYPVQCRAESWISKVFLVLTALVVLTGVVSRSNKTSFSMEHIPEPTTLPMDERFDETLTTMQLELQPKMWYALQMGVFDSKDAAQKSAEAFQRRGAAGYLWLDGRYRVLAAVYPEKEDAQNVRTQLAEQHGIDSYLYVINFPAMLLQLSGKQGQLEIIQSAFDMLDEIAVELQRLSVALDRGEVSVQEIIQSIAKQDETVQTVALRIKQRFEKPYHQTANVFIEHFEAFALFAENAAKIQNAADMGLKLKQQTFATLQMIQTTYQTLDKT